MAQAKYSPFGDTLNPAIAIIQAANALDIAAKMAIDCKDPRTLIEVAKEWVEMSGRLAYDDEEEGDTSDEEREDRRSFGFSVVSDIGEEDEEDADGES
jgi:hypothetical protein